MHSLIFHVDVNSAFLSWESAKRLRDNPDALDLRTINAVIGGDEKMRHGVVLAKSPSAKKYGIMTGEPLSHARQKCPELVVVPPDHELYAASSRKFIEILEEVAPVIEQDVYKRQHLPVTVCLKANVKAEAPYLPLTASGLRLQC